MENGSRTGLQQAAGGGGERGGWVLVEARLQGGAPWGFTLQGGLEYGEPLVISKVEEGGKADSLERPLRVGDEIIIINDVELTGYRQEAVALVKGSHKTLQLTVRRELDPGYIEEFVPPAPSLSALPLPHPPSPPPSFPSPPPQEQQQQQTHRSSPRSPPCSAVQLRIKNRRTEPASRPHSWHSSKLDEGQQELDPAAMDTMSSAWHHGYHASASTTDLSGGFDSGGSYLRKSPDQYSSRGSMDSLDHPQSSQLHSGAQHQHSLSHHGLSGPHPAYSSCHQLSSARSSNSIEHLHSKRDSAYSSFSTSSSIPEYLASTPSFSPERSYSLETVPQRGGGSGDMHQADVRYVQTVYDNQQGLSQEHELNSTSAVFLRSSDSRSGGGSRPGRDLHGSVSGVCYRGSSSGSSSSSGGSSGSGAPASNRHSVGPIWGPAASRSSYESLKGAPAPPRRSDSYAAIRSHERPNSWSSLEHARSLRSLQKGSWHHSSGNVASVSAKGSYGAEGQLHTVIEKSPESSPTTRPRQGGGFPQLPSPTGPSSGSAGPTSQSSRLILPTSMYPVPQPEPHYAQIPSSNPGPGPSGVYPALAKESNRQQQQGLQGVGRDEGAAEGWRDGRMSATENGYQTNTPSYPHSSYPTSASVQLRSQAHEADRHQEEESNFGPYNPHIKTTGGGPESEAVTQRSQNHQGAYSQSVHEQKRDYHIPQIYSGPEVRPPSSQERSDPYAPVQSWGDRNRSVDQSSVHSEPVALSRLAQGQVPPNHSSVQPQAPPSSTSQHSPRHLSESSALQYQHWDHREQDKDKEHPLTRLELALAEVQRCASPESDATQGPARSLSVLEKVSRFERRERAGKQRSHSISHKATHLRNQTTDKGRSAPCGAEDLRNMLERSTKGTKAHRTLSHRGGSSEQMKPKTPTDPVSALQRSRSSFQLDDSKEEDSRKDFPWRQEIQEILAPMQDTSTNRSYRDSLKDVQSKVLRSTSFKRRDLGSSVSAPPSAAPPSVSSSGTQQPPLIPPKYHSLEKKGPKTMPKPQGIVITPQSQPLVTSPHTPKERHMVTPDVRGPSPPPLPSVPPVGHPAPVRICGRKRLTADQKKRSYSEPENMNEVGICDAETMSLFRRGEASVADRRKMFELAASRVGGGPSQNPTPRPDLRQVQQEALAEYVERKRGVRRDEGGQRSMSRPRSAYFQPENSNHAVSSCYSDTLSLSSTSSLLSLQDSGPASPPGENRLSSTLPPGADLRSHQSNFFYPGRVTTPRPPAHPPQGTPSGSILDQLYRDLSPEAEIRRHSQSSSTEPSLGHERQVAEPQVNQGLSKQLNGALQRAESPRKTGKSASAENLLEQSKDTQASPQHFRSRSSPIMERLNEDLVPDVRMFGVFISKSGRCALAADRPANICVPEDLVSPSQNSTNTFQPVGPSQDPGSSQTPVTRRERQRNSERQRVHSTSTLAASVGLPCPFSPPGTQDGGGAQWQASERLSQANLDAITFPGIPQASAGSGEESKGVGYETQTRHSSSDAILLEETVKDVFRGRAFSLDRRGGLSEENAKPVSPVTPAPPPHFQLPTSSKRKGSGSATSSPLSFAHPSVRLSSLRISETSLFGSVDQQHPPETSTGTPLEDYDEVFLQSSAPPPPPPPPPPSPPIRETNITDDFPLPPPPVELEQEAKEETVGSSTSEFSIISTRKSSLRTSPVTTSSVPTQLPSLQPSTTTPATASATTEDNLSLEYQPLPKREKTSEELRVEALAQRLVLQDASLAPLLDTWGGKSTIELLEEIFPNSKLISKSQWTHRGSGQVDEGTQVGVCSPAQSTVADRSKENDLDEEEKDLNTRKVELCEALRSSMAALKREKEALCEEQRHHKVLGDSMETLVQDHLKTNEKDKYSMFIGDLEKIVNLLLSLCSRLSRIDRSLLALQRDGLSPEEAAEERDSLNHKRSLLLRQTEDARELKENLDRRQRVVHAILSGYLTEPQLQDYRRYVSAKPSLLIRQRHLDDLIRRGEEQLTQLAESLPAELAEAHGWSTASTVPCSSSFPPLLPPAAITGPTHVVRPTTVTSL
ncbi:protein Shroom3 [Archocentrus centrarchus]|uniref:protein Shroom3 n=1 Tax=Archocentrus centrarchus TaxID=63155 RepID=UPI0011EA2426|nr:protein Shroom3-like [Archocentrus centrarchus]